MKPRRSSRCDGAIALENQLKPPARYDPGSPGVDMIAALIIAPDELDQLAADARRLGIAQPAGHLPVMIAVGKRRRRFTHRRSSQVAGSRKLAGGAQGRNNLNPRPRCQCSRR